MKDWKSKVKVEKQVSMLHHARMRFQNAISLTPNSFIYRYVGYSFLFENLFSFPDQIQLGTYNVGIVQAQMVVAQRKHLHASLRQAERSCG